MLCATSLKLMVPIMVLEKFGPDYRFAFFPSFSLGWMISEEKIVKNNLKFLDMLKLRASWGRVGDDAVVQPWQRFTDGRFLYKNQLDYGGNTLMGNIKPANTPYTYYKSVDWGILISHGKL